MGFTVKGGGGTGTGGTTDHNALTNKNLPNQHAIDAITGLLEELGKRPQTDDVNVMINSIIDGAPEAYNTLKEIADYIAQDQSAGASILASLGNKVDKEAGKGLSSNDYTDTDKSKVHDHANSGVLDKVGESAGGNFTYNGVEISGGSGGTSDHNSLTNRNIDNQHTINAIQGLQAELDKRVSVIIGKGLSSNDYDNTDKSKVDNLNITQVVDLDAVKNASHTHANTSVLSKIGEDENGNIIYNNNHVNDKLANARTIGISGKIIGTATSFDGSSNIAIPVTSVIADSCTGNSETANKLKNPVSINGIPFDGSANIDIPTGSSSGGANSPSYFSRDIPFYASDKLTIATPNRLWVNMAKNGYMLETQKTFDISADASWDSTATLWQANHDYAVNDVIYPSATKTGYYYRCTTAGNSSTLAPTFPTTLGATCNDGNVVWICELDFTVAENRKGKDFYIYSCIPANGTEPIIVLSANSTVPLRYTADTSRKIGGFHTLCADVGTITGHTLSGYVAGDILPASVWDLKHRPVCSPEGMVYVDGLDIWIDIYLASYTGSYSNSPENLKLVSKYGANTADGASAEKFHWYKFSQVFSRQKKRMLHHSEFIAASIGSNQSTNIYGSADVNTTGGHIDTASRRMISNFGLEDCCGFLWQWGQDDGGTNTGGSYANAYDVNDKYVGGQSYADSSRVLLGGYWSNAAFCGSRCSVWNSGPLALSSNYGSRGASEPLRGAY